MASPQRVPGSSEDGDPKGSIRFYFSFRSPYAWLAAERLEEELGDLPVAIERIPVYPTPGLFPNDPVGVPAKSRYFMQDVARLTRERGLTLRFPEANDTDWVLPHAAALRADELGAGHAFVLELFRKRWSEGLDVGSQDVIGDAAEHAGLDRAAVLAGTHEPALRERAADGFRLGIERDAIFGVPSFVYAGKLYWGQDRMHFLRSAVERKHAEAS